MVRKKKPIDKDKVVGYNTKNKNVFNDLNGVYIGGESENIDFLRSPEQLLKQYHNLIHKMGRQYGSSNMTAAERQDLYAYISEVFIDLVKEFDMSNGMDFPGYVARMLPARIRGSYLDSVQDYKQHISPVKNPTTSVEKLLDYNYGKPKFTFSYSSKSNFQREKRRDGKTRGILTEIVPTKSTNEPDTSLIEIYRYLDSRSVKDKIIYELVELIGNQGLSLHDAEEVVCEAHHLTKGQISIEEKKLKQLLEPILLNQ